MTDLKSQKQELREQARLHRERMVTDESDYERIIDVFFAEINPDKDKIMALYWPVKKEFDTRFLLDELVKRGFTCCLPKAYKEKRIMTFYEWTYETKMVEGEWGVSEPEEGEALQPDIVIAPLLMFDQKGYRLGQGGGHYDSTLEALRAQKEVQYIGIGYAEQAVLLKLPREEHDIPLDGMLTPQGLIEF